MFAQSSSRHYYKYLFAVIAAAAVMFFTNLGGPRLWDRDEPRNAGCATEMMARGTWVVPYFNNEYRVHKPVLTYWCIMAATVLFGEGEFAARFFSALFGVGTVALTYSMASRLFTPQVGFWAAIALCTSLMFNVASHAATPDAPLIFFITLALACYVWGTFPASAAEENSSGNSASTLASGEPRPLFPSQWPYILGMYASMGVAVLAKGPVGVVLPCAIIGGFMFLQLGWERWQRMAKLPAPWWSRKSVFQVVGVFGKALGESFVAARPVLCLIIVQAVALPWYAAVGYWTEGDWLYGFFYEHHVERVTTVMENHSGSIFYYPAALLFGFFPWSIFALPATIDTVVRLRRGEPTASRGMLFAVVWVVVFVGCFSLARTKLPSYITPTYPALAMLTAVYLVQWRRRGAFAADWWPRVSAVCLMVTGVGMMIAIPLAAGPEFPGEKWLGEWGAAIRARIGPGGALPGEEWLGLFGLIPLAAGIGLWRMVAKDRRGAAVALTAWSSAAFCLLIFVVGTMAVDRHQHIHELWAAIPDEERLAYDTRLYAWGKLDPTWVVYSGRTVELQHPKPDDALEEHPVSKPGSYVITTAANYERLRKRLPQEVVVLERVPVLLRNEELVLLGRADDSPRTAAQPRRNR